MVTNKCCAKISILKCDNSREYIPEKLIKFCEEKGIQIHYTVPYTPQQNGNAERMNRKLVEKSRTLIIDSHMSKEMW